jgi:hypothetical protein
MLRRIYDNGSFPKRTVDTVNKQLELSKFAVARQKAFVETIKPSKRKLEHRKARSFSR